jgi:hypothetical protein
MRGFIRGTEVVMCPVCADNAESRHRLAGWDCCAVILGVFFWGVQQRIGVGVLHS